MTAIGNQRGIGWTRLIGVLLAAMLGSVVMRAQVPATPAGEWQTIDDKKGDVRSIVRIDIQDGELSATIVKAVLRAGEPAHPTCEKCPGEFLNQPIEGLRFMWGLRGQARQWDGGRVLDPEDGKIYRVKVTMSADGQSLDVRGYVGVSLFGRTQTWKRVK